MIRLVASGVVLALNDADAARVPDRPRVADPPPWPTLRCRVAPVETPARWDVELRAPDGEPWLRVLHRPGGEVLSAPERLDVALEGDALTLAPAPGLSAEELEHALFDQILPLLARRFGILSLHGSAVTRGGRGLALVGPSGAGKSTLAYALARGFGFALAGDDGVALHVSAGGAALRTAGGSSRLHADSLRATGGPDHGADERGGEPNKRRAAVPMEPPREVPLAAVALLEEGAPLSLAPVPPRDAALRVAAHVDRLDPSDAGALRWELERLGELALAVPVVALRYPRDFAFAALAAALADLLQAS